MATAIDRECSLSLRRVFDAPIEKVFNAWTDPAALAQWFGPEGFSVIASTIDLTVGGSYEIVLRPPEGEPITHSGTYVAITRPSALVFTWVLQDQPCSGGTGQCAETLVSLDFKSLGQSTELSLMHERLPNKAAVDGHLFGWNGSFDALNAFL